MELILQYHFIRIILSFSVFRYCLEQIWLTVPNSFTLIIRQLQHIVGVTGLWAVDVIHEVDAGFLAGEVLTT